MLHHTHRARPLLCFVWSSDASLPQEDVVKAKNAFLFWRLFNREIQIYTLSDAILHQPTRRSRHQPWSANAQPPPTLRDGRLPVCVKDCADCKSLIKRIHVQKYTCCTCNSVSDRCRSGRRLRRPTPPYLYTHVAFSVNCDICLKLSKKGILSSLKKDTPYHSCFWQCLGYERCPLPKDLMIIVGITTGVFTAYINRGAFLSCEVKSFDAWAAP